MKNEFEHACEQPLALLDYLEQHGWRMLRRSGRGEVAGLCPLHQETQPSFYVNEGKGVFYCHGCGRGGDLIRLIELLEGVPFAQALARSRTLPSAGGPLQQAVSFYQQCLPRCREAMQYLERRGIRSPEVIARMRIGYAPGACCLRAHLQRRSYSRQQIADSGLLNARGSDRFWRCLTIPLDGGRNLYGRKVDDGEPRHFFLPRPKGGLYGWQRVQTAARILVVEGLLDVAALWQAGFAHTVASLGAYLNRTQMAQLCDGEPRCVYLCLDGDEPGQQAARILSGKLRRCGVQVRRVELPGRHDPNSFFCAGATPHDFQRCLDRAAP